ncbi:MAG: nickel-dependent hydrogenase large subunit [Coriobacteriia bacterium]|nr:nickel-dependent hydrogenase large subunit [Coriobacteriia bacterium]
MARAVIDPLTRIEGHMRVEVEVEGGVVTDAWISGTLFRGMEAVLKDRRPQDAFYISQRICGVCPISHGHASTMAAEAAMGVQIPQGARLIRNIIEGAQYLHSHILWFYTLGALDYVDPVKALSANIADTYALAQAAGTRIGDFGAVAKRLAAFVENGQLSIFTNGWFGHPEYAQDMPAELHLIAVAHYLEALEMQGEAAAIIAVMGGKFPHFMTSVNGGTAFVPTEEKLDDVLFRLLKVNAFVREAMIPDTLALAPYYLDALSFGGGGGNFLSWGVFNDSTFELNNRYLPAGFSEGASLGVEDVDIDNVAEYTAHSWYKSPSGLNPKVGETEAAFTDYNTDDKYSWGKAVRYKELPAEVGPLARMVVAYVRGVEPVQNLIDSTLAALGAAGKPEVLVSLLGRVAARNLETAYVADLTEGFVAELIEAIKGGDVDLFTPHDVVDGEGVGMWEAPRGSVAHYMTIKGGKIDRYNVVAPTTWDMAPRDDNGVRGPMEEALIGTPVADVERPMNVVRVARSFDP